MGYRAPTAGERVKAVAVLRAVLAGRRPALLDGLRVSTEDGCTLLTGGQWGTLALPESPELLVEVPHPGSDRCTTRLGRELRQAIPTAALLVAGTHRRTADVAHRTDSVFHAWAQALALPEIQLHGFATASAPGTDAILSPGAGNRTHLHEGLREALNHHGFRVRHHEHLAGRTNAQGLAAAARGTPFLHLELAPAVRLHHRNRVVEAVTHAWHERRR